MQPPKMQMTELVTIRKACLKVATAETSCYPEAYDKEKSPLDGHCAAVATMLQGIFGGDIVTGMVKGVRHYWNRIKGKEYDLTSCQFGGDGYFPIEGQKGRKTTRPKLTNPRFLLFAQRVYTRLSTPKVGMELVFDELTSAWAKLNCAHGVMDSLIKKGWLKEDTAGSKEYFPQGGLPLLEQSMIEVHKHLTNCLIEQDRMEREKDGKAGKERNAQGTGKKTKRKG